MAAIFSEFTVLCLSSYFVVNYLLGLQLKKKNIKKNFFEISRFFHYFVKLQYIVIMMKTIVRNKYYFKIG